MTEDLENDYISDNTVLISVLRDLSELHDILEFLRRESKMHNRKMTEMEFQTVNSIISMMKIVFASLEKMTKVHNSKRTARSKVLAFEIGKIDDKVIKSVDTEE